MKVKPVPADLAATSVQRPRGMPRVAAVRRITPDKPLRAWSLLLPPTFERNGRITSK